MPAARIQPQGIVRANPKWIAKGLTSLYTPSSGAVLVRNAAAAIITATARNTPKGKALKTVGGSKDRVEVGPADTLLGAAVGTVFMFARYTDTTPRTAQTAGCGDANNVSARIFLQPWTDGNFYFDWGGATNGQGRVSGSYIKTLLPFTVAGVAGGNKGRELWLNKVRIAANASDTTARPLLGKAFAWGSPGGDATVAGDEMEVYIGATFNTALSDADIKSLNDNPWELYDGFSAPMLYAASAPSAYNLTGQPTAQSNTSGSGVAGQVHALSGAATAQANTAASASVAQAHALAGAAATQSNASTSGVASQGQALAGAPVAQPNVSSSGALSQIHNLAGAAATQANASSSGAAGQAHQLAGNAATQANTAASGTLSSTLALAGASAAQSNASSAGAIGQVHALAGAQVAQANGSTSAAVGVNGALTGANVVQANTAGSGAATQVHALSGASAAQGNASTSGALTGGSMLAGAPVAQGNTASSGAIAQVHTLGGAACGQANVAGGGRVALFHLLTATASNQINLSPGGAATDLPPVVYARAPAGPGYSRPFTNTTRPRQVNTRRT
jgi:hypothetical protein